MYSTLMPNINGTDSSYTGEYSRMFSTSGSIFSECCL